MRALQVGREGVALGVVDVALVTDALIGGLPVGAPLPVAPETTRSLDGPWVRTPVPSETVESKLPEMLSVSKVKAEAAPT